MKSNFASVVRVVYHHEDGVWWADSDDMPGFYAAGDSFSETRENVRGGVSFYFNDGMKRNIKEYTDDGAELMSGNHKIYEFPSNIWNNSGVHIWNNRGVQSNSSYDPEQSISSLRYSEKRLVLDYE